MKKLIFLIMVAAICFTLFACNESSEETQDPATAPFLDLDAYTALKEEDPDEADEEYEGKVYRYTGMVVHIEDDYCMLGYTEFDPLFDTYKCIYELKVYLDDEDLETLVLDETYTFSGKLRGGESLPEFRNAVMITE